MAITPFVKLGSQDILAAHPNGIQYALNNLESILNMKTVTKSGQPLSPVTDTTDPADRYRIYEATDRSWLTSPAPVIKRNGSVVSASEYVIQHAYGVVIFTAKQQVTDAITADFTHITSDSILSDSVDDLNTNVPMLPKVMSVGTLVPKTAWITNLKDLSATASAATGVSQAVNTIDAFPIYVPERMTLDRIKFVMNKSTVAGNMIAGLYSNKEHDVWPDARLATTAVIAVSAGDTINNVTVDQALTAEVTVNPGLYWLARYQSAGVSMEGYTIPTSGATACIEVLDPEDSTLVNGSSGKITGVRTANLGTLSALPATFPALTQNAASGGAQYLKRTSIGNLSIKRKA